jgi:hypothetical protein
LVSLKIQSVEEEAIKQAHKVGKVLLATSKLIAPINYGYAAITFVAKVLSDYR